MRTAPAQQPALTIGAVTAQPGTMASGFIEVPFGVDSATRNPITHRARGRRGADAGPDRRHPWLGSGADPGTSPAALLAEELALLA